MSLQTGRRTIGLEPDDRLPSENVGVLRVRRPVFNARSTAGAMLTSRISEDGATNLALGLDADVRVFEESFLSLNAVQTVDSGVEGAPLWDTARFRARLERRAYVGTSYSATVELLGRGLPAGPGLRAAVGLTRRCGASVSQGWGAGGPFSPPPRRGLVAGVRAQRGRLGRDCRQRPERGTVSSVRAPRWRPARTSPARTCATGSRSRTTPTCRRAPTRSPRREPAPGRRAASRSGRASPSAGAPFTTAGGSRPASSRRGWSRSTSPCTGATSSTGSAFPDRDQTFTAHVGRLRVRAALDTRWSLSSVVQLNSAARGGLLNLRLRYNPREGRDLYLVINEGFHTDRLRASPARPFTSQRAVLAKVTTTFAL